MGRSLYEKPIENLLQLPLQLALPSPYIDVGSGIEQWRLPVTLLPGSTLLGFVPLVGAGRKQLGYLVPAGLHEELLVVVFNRYHIS
jgi:hypothetical protein